MNSMNDERFFELAMKGITGQATDSERVELDVLLGRESELKAKFARLQADVRFMRVMREVLRLVNAVEENKGAANARSPENGGRIETASV